MIPLCLMWCIWRERNIRNFKDCEKTVIDLKAFMFKSLYDWMAGHKFFCFSNSLEFLDMCIFFLNSVFLVLLSVYLGCAPLRFFMRFDY
jgi:hypothetical protein